MALEGLHVPSLSNGHLNLTAKALATVAVPCNIGRSLAFGQGRFWYLRCIHSRGASVNIKRKWCAFNSVVFFEPYPCFLFSEEENTTKYQGNTVVIFVLGHGSDGPSLPMPNLSLPVMQITLHVAAGSTGL